MVATSTSPLERLKKPFRFEDLQKPFKLEDFLVVIEAEKARENAREKRERLEDIRQGAIVLERENNALKNKIIQLTEEEIGTLRSDLPPPEIISMLREKLEKDKEEVREGTRLGASEVRETISGVAESAENQEAGEKKGFFGWLRQKGEVGKNGFEKATNFFKNPKAWFTGLLAGIGISLALWWAKIRNGLPVWLGGKDMNGRITLLETLQKLQKDPSSITDIAPETLLALRKEFGGQFPDMFENLPKLPTIGEAQRDMPETVEKKTLEELEKIYGEMSTVGEAGADAVGNFLEQKRLKILSIYKNQSDYVQIGGAALAKIGGIEIISGVLHGVQGTGGFALTIVTEGSKFLAGHPLIGCAGLIALFRGSQALMGLPLPADSSMWEDYIQNEVLEGPRFPEAREAIEAFQIKHPEIDLDFSQLQDALNPEKFEEYYEMALGSITNVSDVALRAMFPEREAFVKNIDILGIDAFLSYLQSDHSDKRRTISSAETLLHKLRKLGPGEHMTREMLNALLDTAEEEGIQINIRGSIVSYIMRDSAGEIILIRNLCTNPGSSLDRRHDAAKLSNIGGGYGNPFIREGQVEFGDIGRKLKDVWEKSDSEKAGVIGEILRKGWGTITVIGKEVIFDGLVERYVLGTTETFGNIWDILVAQGGNGKKLMIQEAVAEYADGLVPILILTYGTSIINGTTGWKGLYKPLVRTIFYPVEAIVTTTRTLTTILADRTLSGCWKRIMSDPLHEYLSYLFQFLERSKTADIRRIFGSAEIKHIIYERKMLLDLYKIKGLLYRSSRKGLHMDLLKEAQHIFDRELNNHPGIKGHAHPPLTDDSKIRQNIDMIDQLITGQKKNIRTAVIEGVRFDGQRLIGQTFDTSFQGHTDTEKLTNAKHATQTEIQRLDAEFDTIQSQLKSGTLNRTMLEKLRRRSAEIVKLRSRHAKLIKILDLHLHPTFLKHLGRYKNIGIIGLLGGMVAVGLNQYKPGEMSEKLSHELDKISERELDEVLENVNHPNEEMLDTIESSTMKMQFMRIAESYDDLVTLHEAPNTNTALHALIETHKKNINTMRTLVKNTENREILLDIFKKHPSGEMHITPFFSIEKKDGIPHLAYLDEKSFRKYAMEDLEGSEFLEGIGGMKNTGLATTAIDAGTYMIPFVGTGRDFYDSLEAFSREGIWSGSAFSSLGWGVIGAASDALLITGIGAGFGAGLKVLRGSAAGLKGAHKFKVARMAFATRRIQMNEMVKMAQAGKRFNNLSTMKRWILRFAMHKGKAYLFTNAGQLSYMGLSTPKNVFEKI